MRSVGTVQQQRRHDGPVILFQDEFIDTNGTDLASHTPDVGSGWTEIVLGTNPTIQSNRCDSGGTCEWRCDSTAANCTIHFVAHNGGAQNACGLRFRGTSASNFTTSYLLWMNDTSIELYKGFTFVATVWGVANYNTTRTFRVELNGTSIKIYVDGGLRYSRTDSYAQTGTYHGFRFYNATNNYIERFQVEEYNAL